MCSKCTYTLQNHQFIYKLGREKSLLETFTISDKHLNYSVLYFYSRDIVKTELVRFLQTYLSTCIPTFEIKRKAGDEEQDGV